MPWRIGTGLGYERKTATRATQLPKECRPDAVYVPRIGHYLFIMRVFVFFDTDY